MSAAPTPHSHPSLPTPSSSPAAPPYQAHYPFGMYTHYSCIRLSPGCPDPLDAVACVCITASVHNSMVNRIHLEVLVHPLLNPFDPGTILICAVRTLSSLQTLQCGS